jgi:DNA-directed RNA polymerase subunit RPC12/RpoP
VLAPGEVRGLRGRQAHDIDDNLVEGGEGALARANTKPGKDSYVCSKCETTQELKTAASTLKACPKCGSTLFREVSGRSSAA